MHHLQESEIVEVLWKQDVDLGYSLTPFVSDDTKLAPNQTTDDNEKLKVLEDIKNGKVRVFGECVCEKCLC